MAVKDELQKAKDELDATLARKKEEQAKKDREALVSSMTEKFSESMKMIVQEFSDAVVSSKMETLEAIKNLRIEPPVVNVPEIKVPDVKVPDIKLPEINVPEPKITIKQEPIKVDPIETKGIEKVFEKFLDFFKKIKIVVPKPEVTVNVPEIKAPKVVMPKEMEIKGDVGLKGVDRKHPIPMILVDQKGEYYQFSFSGGVGGGPRIVKLDATQVAALAKESTLSGISNKLPNLMGTPGYTAGTSGTVVLSGNKKVVLVTAVALEAQGTMTINGGSTIIIPYGSTDQVSTGIGLPLISMGNWVDPTFVFTGTDAYTIFYTTD